MVSAAQPAQSVDLPPDLATVLAYWDRQRTGAFAPAWGSYRLTDFASNVLPWMVVLDLDWHAATTAVDDLPSMRYRFWGTEWTRLYRQEMSGKDVETFTLTDVARSLRQQYGQVIDARHPLAFSNVYPTPSGAIAEFITIRMPLSSDGETIDKIACATTFLRNREAFARMFEDIRHAAAS